MKNTLEQSGSYWHNSCVKRDKFAPRFTFELILILKTKSLKLVGLGRDEESEF